MSSYQTGEAATGGIATKNRGVFSNTHVQDAGLRKYDIPFVGSGSTASEDDSRDKSGRRTIDAKLLVSHRFNIRKWSAQALAAAKSLRAAAEQEDFMEATSAGVEMIECLGELWAMRASRESEFAEVVNIAETTLKGTAFESLTVQECDLLVEMVEKCIVPGLVTVDDVRLARRLFRGAGFNPWRGITVNEQ